MENDDLENAEIPLDIHVIPQFLGFQRYFRIFINEFPEITKPLGHEQIKVSN